MRPLRTVLLCLILGGIAGPSAVWAAEDAKPWTKLEYQCDTRGFNTLNVEGASPLPEGFEFWGFIDVNSPDAPNSSRTDLKEFFLEADLKHPVWQGLGGIAEYNDGNGSGDSKARFGLYYQPDWAWLKKQDLWLFTKWFPIGTEPAARQGSFAWNWAPKNILWGRFSTGGFYDINFDEKEGHTRPQVVTEVQLRYRIVKNTHLFREAKYNQFLEKDKETGLGAGLQYYFE